MRPAGLISSLLLLAGFPCWAQGPAPQFRDPQRKEKLLAASERISAAFERYHQERHTPGLIFGLVIDGELVLTKSFGVANLETKAPVTAGTRFRIASMTKSFTALAILKLRDEGKLSLEDPVAKWIPAVAQWKLPTADSAPVRVRNLLTHTAGLPEDNPWGDQQLGVSDTQLDEWLEKGLPFSNTPGREYEYSNYGFALLGRIVQVASGQPYRQYLEEQILRPLGMNDSTLEPSTIPANLVAIGYRRVVDTGGGGGDARYQIEPSLPHGAFGAMGGLVTTAGDMAKYVAFHLGAFPDRDGTDPGPVRRSSVREMQEMARFSAVSRTRPFPPGAPQRTFSRGYGYGLGVTNECGFGRIVSHGGGLPGFGSQMVWLPEFGVGIFTMSNLTYSGASAPAQEAVTALRNTGALKARELASGPVLDRTKQQIYELFQDWNESQLKSWAASNLLLDRSADLRKRDFEELRAKAGSCRPPGPVEPENWLRGDFRMECDRGSIRASFTLAPTNPPTVQYLSLEHLPALTPDQKSLVETLAGGRLPKGSQLARQADKSPISATLEAAKTHHGACKFKEVSGGDGKKSLTLLLDCDRDPQRMDLTFVDGRLSSVSVSQPGPNCN